AGFGTDSSSQRGKRVKMLGIRQALPREHRRAARAALGLAVAALCVFCLLGCATEDRPGNDPLLTGATRRGVSPAPATPVSAPAAPAAATPALPSPHSPTSTAALATGASASPDANHDLRIPGREKNPEGGSGGAGSTGWQAQGAPTGAAPRGPEGTPVSRLETPAGGGVILAGGYRINSYEQAQSVLAA